MKALSQTSFKTLMATKHSFVSDSAAVSRIRRSPFHRSYTIHLLAVSVCVRACFCETLVHIPAFHINLYITDSSFYGVIVITVCLMCGLTDEIAMQQFKTLFIACELKTKPVLKHICVHLVMQVFYFCSLFSLVCWQDKNYVVVQHPSICLQSVPHTYLHARWMCCIILLASMVVASVVDHFLFNCVCLAFVSFNSDTHLHWKYRVLPGFV